MSHWSFQHIAPELRVFHGDASLESLRRELERGKCSRAVVFSGRTVSRSDAMAVLRMALGPVLVSEAVVVREHSPVSAVEEAARLLDDAKADSVIAVGGGSAAVTARAASILLAERKPVNELCTRRLPDGKFDSPRLAAPKIAQFVVPTTPSNAFVKAGSAVHDEEGNRLALFDPKTRARGIFVHPAFLRTAPDSLVLSASLNTLSTALEALESPKCDPISEAMLMHALRLTSRHLPGLHNGGDAAREALVVAGILCGRGTEQGGGGLSSVLAHAIGHRTHTANGVVNAIMLPHTMRFNAGATATRADSIIDALDQTDAPSAADAVAALLEQVPVARRLRDIGVAQQDLDAIAHAAMADWFVSRNPRPVKGVAEVRAILEAAW